MSIYNFSATLLTGEKINFENFKDKVLLIVNTASKCGFTPQYANLEKIYKTHKDDGFEILGFPCNQFKEQEPGSSDEIAEFCQINYGVTFKMFEKINVNGENQDPLYKYLKEQIGFNGFDYKHPLASAVEAILTKTNPNFKDESDIKWNFTKFLVNRNGQVIKRFEPTTNMKIVEEEIKNTL